MRIIAGTLGGRSFESPHGHRTHPMSDKIRGALFNMLGDLEGLVVLDAFAGSGALSFEAISRGAISTIAIDIDPQAAKTIIANRDRLNLGEQIRVVRQNVGSWSRDHPGAEFDIVLADPPYDGIKIPVLEVLAAHVVSGGLYVLSWPGNLEAPILPGLEQISLKHYGDASLVIYRRN